MMEGGKDGRKWWRRGGVVGNDGGGKGGGKWWRGGGDGRR